VSLNKGTMGLTSTDEHEDQMDKMLIKKRNVVLW